MNDRELQALIDKAVAAERDRCVAIVGKLYVHGHWTSGGVLHALGEITGTKWTVRDSRDYGGDGGLDWSDEEGLV